MRVIWIFTVLSFNLMAHNFTELERIAKKSITTNIVELDTKNFLRAGANHFGSLWTRDFAYSIERLLSINRSDVVRDHLELLFENIREDGLVPRVLDNMKSEWRVIRHLSLLSNPKPIKLPLKAEYIGEHSTVAIDSNVLVLRGAFLYAEATKDWEWLEDQKKILKKIFYYYNDKFKDGLITQEDYGDWQDSVKRTGLTFLTNLHYYDVLVKLNKYEFLKANPFPIKELLIKNFLTKNGVFKSHKDLDVVSIDGNLFALQSETFLEGLMSKEALYQNLKFHPLYTQYEIPGFASYPNYPNNMISLNVKAVGLKRYHDDMYWSWLMGLAAKTAFQMNDKELAEKILSKLEKISIKEEGITEVIQPGKNLKPFKKFLYRSEKPFSWGSAFILDALSIAY